MFDENGNPEKGYLGNPNLKKPRQSIGWSEDQVKEWVKCAHDPVYFAEKYVQVVHVDHGFIPIRLYDYQKEIVEKITKNRRLAVCTSRQAGKTTTAAVVILHYILFNSYKRVALLANKADAAREILERIKLAYEALPKWLQQGILEWNKGSVSLENGSSVIAAATSSSAIRGKSVALLYIDETAFVENWEEFFSSVFPTISSGKKTKILYTSTPNGLNHFYKTCMYAQAERDSPEFNGFEYVEVPWQRVPGRDEAWRKETLAAMDGDTEQFAQEFECEFQGSSSTLISGACLKTLVAKQPLKVHDGLTQYMEPEEGHRYVMTVDTSQGKGLDYSTFQMIDVTKMPYQQVCTYKNNLITPLDFAEVIFRIGKQYNDATILIELNDVGEMVAESLYNDFESDSLIFTESAGSRGKRISTGFGKSSEKGIRVSKTVKGMGCSVLKLLVEQYQLIINDYDTIYELSRFSRKGNSYEAESGAHDDMVMPLVIFAWMTDQQYFKDITDINTLMKLRDKTDEEIMRELAGVGFISDGHEAHFDSQDYAPVIDLTQEMHDEFRNFF